MAKRERYINSCRLDNLFGTMEISMFGTIEILGLEGESTNEKLTIFLGYQGKFIMVLTSAVRPGCLKQVSPVS
jgi:hypothetical protein